jgi:hypothetical protein
MRRSSVVAFLVLGAALALVALGTNGLAPGRERDPVRPSVAAGPQSATLGWVETYGDGRERMVFEVERLNVDADGWRAHVAITNGTSVPYEIVNSATAARFGLMLFATGGMEELERRNADRTLPAVRPAKTFEPALPKLLPAGETWRGVISAPGALAAGTYARVAFGVLVSVGEPPEGVSRDIPRITDHAYQLRR